jgi:3'-5' exoribonuclease
MGEYMMENKEIKSLRSGDNIQIFLLIKNVESKVSSNNKKYLDFTLGDRTGEINAKLWDCSNEDETKYLQHTIIKVKGIIQEWQNKLQIKIEKIRPVALEDGISVNEFVPVAPQDAKLMFAKLEAYIAKIRNDDLRKIVEDIITEKKTELLIYPAAKSNHHAVRSGLLCHITTMLEAGEKMCEVYQTLNADLIYAGIILHDIAKIEEMQAGDLGIVSEYTVAGELLGHIIQGIKLIDRAALKVGADKEISLLLEHIILSHHNEPEFGSPKRPMLPEAEMIHYLDIIDARMYDMSKILENTNPGQLSDKVWLLNNRKLYKTSF